MGYKSLSAVVSADEQSQARKSNLQLLKQSQAVVPGRTL